jgi:hypothetical protein
LCILCTPVRSPGQTGWQGETSPRPVEFLSIYLRLIDLCGLAPNRLIEGISLKPLLDNPQAEWPHAAVTTLGQNNHAVRTERWRYDHDADPNGWTNLASDPGPAIGHR